MGWRLVPVVLAAAAAGAGPGAPADTTFLIRGATVVDGTGAPARRAAVRVDGDRIAEVGALEPRDGEAVVDARGLVLAPGFVDTHSHHDRGLLDHPGAPGAVSQGITTVVVGQDGGSSLPLADFFAAVADTGVAVNVASYAGHGTIRERVMAEDFRREATPAEVDSMRALLRRELEAGALGLSSGLEYDPGIYASTDEVIALAREAGRVGGRYISHVRSEDRRLWEAVDEAVRIGREADVPVQISHMKLAMQSLWGRADELLARLDSARAAGVDVTADVYPYTYWQSTMTVLFPERDFDDRAVAEFALEELVPPEGMRIAEYEAEPDYQGRTLAEVAESRGEDPVTAYMALIAMAEEADADESILATSMAEEDVVRLLSWEHANVASDGGLLGGHPRGFGAFTRVVGPWVRAGRLTLEDAVRKASGLGAAHVGIEGRGVIRPGAFADLVLFDPERVVDRATPDHPRAVSAGIERVWVNGRLVYEGGAGVTGARPGRVLRRGDADGAFDVSAETRGAGPAAAAAARARTPVQRAGHAQAPATPGATAPTRLARPAGAVVGPDSGVLHPRVRSAHDSAMTYALYLPPGHDPSRPAPVLLVMDPRGRALLALDLFRTAAGRHGWVVLSSYDTRSDDPEAPNEAALDAMLVDAQSGFAVDTRRLYLAGFSGTARVAWRVAEGLTDHVAGVIGFGAADMRLLVSRPRFALFGGAGREDFNYHEVRSLARGLETPERPVAHVIAFHDGPHAWPGPELCGAAIDWMELRAMAEGLAPVDAAFVRRFHDERLARARSLEAAGRPEEALAAYRAAARDLADVRAAAAAAGARPGPAAGAMPDTVAAAAEAERLASSPAVTRRTEALDAEGKAFRRFAARLHAQAEGALGGQAIDPEAAASALELDAWRERARHGEPGSLEREAAARVLALAAVRYSFYLPRDLLEAGRVEAALAALDVAERAGVSAPRLCLLRARALARLGREAEARERVRCAEEAGVPREAMEADADLAPLLARPPSGGGRAGRAPAGSVRHRPAGRTLGLPALSPTAWTR